MPERKLLTWTRFALAWICVIVALAPHSAAAAERGKPVSRRVPVPQLTQRIAPHDVDGFPLGELIRDDAGNLTQRFTFGAVHLDYQFPKDVARPDSEVVITLRDPEGLIEEWYVSYELLRRLQDDAMNLFAQGAEQQSRGKPSGEPVFQQLERHLTDPIGTADLLVFEAIHRTLSDRVTQADLVDGTRQLLPAGDLGLPEKGECLGSVGRGLVALGLTIGCWATTPLSLGLHGPICVILTGSTALAAFQIAQTCPTSGSSGLLGSECDCTSATPDCMCCSLDPGDVCNCSCPGEACCDWDGAETSIVREATR